MATLEAVEFDPFKRSPLDAALDAEGVKGPLADVARSIYMQESAAGKNTKTSNRGAVGGMQILPGTFSGVADKDWDINDPTQNARAGIRYLKQGYEASGGDPALAGAFYYGGPGGLEKARRGVAVSDPKNPGAPNTLQYGAQVAARIPKEKGLLQRGVEAIIPSAEAATGPTLEPVDFDPFAKTAPATGAAAEPTAAFGVFPKARREAGNNRPNALNDTLVGITAGGVAGAAGIGNRILDAAQGATKMLPDSMLEPQYRKQPSLSALVAGPQADPQDDRRKALRDFEADNKDSIGFSAAKLGTEIAGTAGVGGALAGPLRAAAPAVSAFLPAAGNALSKFASAVGSGGMTVGGAPATTAAQGAGNLLARAAGGAVTGGASAALVDPDTAGTGALIGGALPIGTKVAGLAGNALGRGIAGKAMSPEVQQLAARAKALGIDIPADRLASSKPLNALAASLDYVPGSGRAATMDKLEDQLNTSLSKTFGQNSTNVTAALRKAQADLGSKFDQVLKNNTVVVDQQFLTDLADAANMASKELGTDGAKIIGNQVDEIMLKAANGDIDGQAAYNIKRTLDRISQRNSPEAYYARDLKSKLMAALDRSLGPQQAADFALVRKQYGNMLSLENIAQNGAEGNISIARLANMKNINNPELQELADISAQFLKSREGAHGAAQRVGAGALALGLTGPQGLVAGMATGRGANMLLNSNMMKNAVSGTPQTNRLLQFGRSPEVQQLLYRSAPVAGSQ